MAEDYVKFVYYCTLCHVRVVAIGSNAMQLMDLVARAEEAGDKESIKALTTCGTCQQVLCESNPIGRSNNGQL